MESTMEVAIERTEISNDKIHINQYLLLVFSGVLGILFDYFFYHMVIGISHPIFALLFSGLFFWFLRVQIKIKKIDSWIFYVFCILLSFTFAIFTNSKLITINLFIFPVLLFGTLIITASKNYYHWFRFLFIIEVAGFILSSKFNLFKPFGLLFSAFKSNEKPKSKLAIFKKVFLGMLLSLPLLFLIIPLLSSADDSFLNFIMNNLSEIIDFIKKLDYWTLIGHGFIILIVSVGIFALLWSIYHNDSHKDISNRKLVGSTKRMSLDAITVSTVLVVLNMVFVLFVVLQFPYLFGGSESIGSNGFSYSTYARKGFFELLAITFINLGIILLTLYFTQKQSKKMNIVIRSLLGILIGCSFIILYSAHIRLSLYEDALGYTFLRILPHSFMIYISALLMLSVYKLIKDEFLFVKYAVWLSLLWYISFNYINVDEIIVNKNIERYYKTEKMDLNYLTSLSYEAIPSLIEFRKTHEQIKPNRNFLFYGYLDEHFNKVYKNLQVEESWFTYNISKARAKNALKEYLDVNK